jgi:uncharacterized membrane protein
MNVPIHAKVQCADGECGETLSVIVNPGNAEVTHVVVAMGKGRRRPQLLVPIEYVTESTRDLVTLSCSQEELSQMESFIETEYVKGERYIAADPLAAEYMTPYAYASYEVEIPVDMEKVPPGKLAIRRGTQVEATDGRVGQVDELLLDQTGSFVTHFIMSSGHLWGKRDIMVPLSAIDHVGGQDNDTVFLTLDKDELARLPAIPAVRKYRDVELIARVFDEPGAANSALEFVQELHRFQRIRVRSAAVVVKDENGEVSIKETADLDVKGGRVLGAITGGLVGLLGGPVGAIIGALAGAGVGGAAAKRIDVGLPDAFLEEVQEHLKPGGSALIMLVQSHWAHSVGEELSGIKGVALQSTISDAVVERLQSEQAEG